MVPEIKVGDNYILGKRLYWRTVRNQDMADRLNADPSEIKAIRRVIWRAE